MVSAAALFVALAIAPGLLFIAMAARRMRVARDLGNAPLTLSFGASASLFVHLVVAGVVWISLRVLEGPPFGTESDALALGRMVASLQVLVAGPLEPETALRSFVNSMVYAFLAALLGAALGYAFGGLVMTGRLETDFFHRGIYCYVREGGARFVFASVLSKTEIDDRPRPTRAGPHASGRGEDRQRDRGLRQHPVPRRGQHREFCARHLRLRRAHQDQPAAPSIAVRSKAAAISACA